MNLKPKYAPTPSLKRRMHRAGPDNPEPSCKDPVAEFQMLEVLLAVLESGFVSRTPLRITASAPTQAVPLNTNL